MWSFPPLFLSVNVCVSLANAENQILRDRASSYTGRVPWKEPEAKPIEPAPTRRPSLVEAAVATSVPSVLGRDAITTPRRSESKSAPRSQSPLRRVVSQSPTAFPFDDEAKAAPAELSLPVSATPLNAFGGTHPRSAWTDAGSTLFGTITPGLNRAPSASSLLAMPLFQNPAVAPLPFSGPPGGYLPVAGPYSAGYPIQQPNAFGGMMGQGVSTPQFGSMMGYPQPTMPPQLRPVGPLFHPDQIQRLQQVFTDAVPRPYFGAPLPANPTFGVYNLLSCMERLGHVGRDLPSQAHEFVQELGAWVTQPPSYTGVQVIGFPEFFKFAAFWAGEYCQDGSSVVLHVSMQDGWRGLAGTDPWFDMVTPVCTTVECDVRFRLFPTSVHGWISRWLCL